MTIDFSTLTPRELEIYAAGYLDAATDKTAELQRADAYLEEMGEQMKKLTRELELANSDADRYYRAAFNPRPTAKPAVSLTDRNRQRDSLYVTRSLTTIAERPAARRTTK